MNLEAYLPAGLDSGELFIFMAALSAFTSVFAVWYTLLSRDSTHRRIRSISAQRNAMRAGFKRPQRRQERLQPLTLMKRVVNKLKLLQSTQTEKVTTNLMRAGWRSSDAIIRFLFLKIAMPFIIGGIAAILVYGLDIGQFDPTGQILVCLFAGLAAAYSPDIFVRNAAGKRQEKIRKAIPDALDLMVICAEAGLSLDATLMRVADEIAEASPEIADELGVTSLELGFLPDRRKALQNLIVRTDVPSIRAMINTLIQSERYGTPLAHSLRVLANESRDERILKAEEKAARLPALLTVPMIVFILPPLFIVLIGPAGLDIADAFKNL